MTENVANPHCGSTLDQSPDEAEVDPATAKAIAYGQRLLNAAIDLVGDAKVELDEQWARHPHLVALTILCRSICNFRASLRLAQDKHVMEARVLVRLLYENVLWLNMVKLRGAAFVEEMRQDEFANRKALAQLTMELSGRRWRCKRGWCAQAPIHSQGPAERPSGGEATPSSSSRRRWRS